MNPLAARQIKNCVVYPTIRVPSHPGKLLMGVFDEDGTYVDDTVLNRRSGEQGAPIARDLFPDIVDSSSPEAIYAGPLYFHFGHFLLESLARAWYARQHPDVPLVWAGAHTWQTAKLRPWQTEILEVLGISNPVAILADPTRFELLHVPDIGYRYDDTFHPGHADFLGTYEGPAQVEGERLWLSRAKVTNDARDFNSAPTERRLSEAGWTIVNPEQLSVREQLDHLSRAEVVAGEEGSAFHTLILLKDISAKRFQILRRHGPEHRNMRTIGDARHVNQTFHTPERERVINAEGRVVSKVNPSSSEILDILEVPVAPRPAVEATADRDLRRQVIDNLAPQSVLEIGGTDAGVALGVTAELRVAVSPGFAFDLRSYADSGVHFYDLDLEQYAEHFDEHGKFDAISINGVDLDELMGSFRVSKRFGHSASTWVFGTGELAARAALTVKVAHPGYAARRLIVGRTAVFVAQRATDELTGRGAVSRLSSKELAKQTRWLPTSVSRPRKEK